MPLQFGLCGCCVWQANSVSVLVDVRSEVSLIHKFLAAVCPSTGVTLATSLNPSSMHSLCFLAIQGELEKLNQSTDDINRRETELEDARQKFRSVLVEATVKLDELVKKIGKAVEDSKPYWEARRVARQAQLEAQKATQDFQRATEVLRAAKETISLAEQRLLEDDKRQFDSAWQEMLNHATQRVMEAEQTKTRSELVHKETAARYNAAMGRMRQLEKKLKRAINKSKPYFELKAKYYVQLEQLKKTVDDLQAKLTLAKGEYKMALKNLEMISDEIHERRRSSAMGPRGCGVGAEGSSTSVEDLPGSKPEPDAISGDRAEGAENKTSDKANNNRGLSNSSGSGGSSKSQSSISPEGQALENRMKQLSLQCSKGRDGIIADIKMVQIG
nr:SH3 domain-binding protein 5 isoform X4 [Pongo pygmaeus]